MAGRYAEQWRSCPGAQLFSDPLHDARSRAPAYGVTPNHEHPTRAVPLPRFNSGRRMTGWASSSGMKFSMLRHALGRRKACTSRIAVDWLVVLERTGRRRSKDHPRPLQAKPPNELLPSKEKPDRKPVKSPSWRPGTRTSAGRVLVPDDNARRRMLAKTSDVAGDPNEL